MFLAVFPGSADLPSNGRKMLDYFTIILEPVASNLN
jgi:hypothetical protein